MAGLVPHKVGIAIRSRIGEIDLCGVFRGKSRPRRSQCSRVPANVVVAAAQPYVLVLTHFLNHPDPEKPVSRKEIIERLPPCGREVGSLVVLTLWTLCNFVVLGFIVETLKPQAVSRKCPISLIIARASAVWSFSGPIQTMTWEAFW